jgi:DnaJ-class molecular chaperone
MIVRVRVVTPTHLNEEQKRLLTQLKESLGEDGSAKDGKGLIGKIKKGLD